MRKREAWDIKESNLQEAAKFSGNPNKQFHNKIL